MKKNCFITLLFCLIASISFSQNYAYNVKAKIKGFAPNQNIYLAHYLGGTQYIKIDSAKAVDQEVAFKGNDNVKGGIYLLVMSPSKFYDFILSGNEKAIEITADTTDFLGTVKFKGSKENDALYDYRRFLKSKNDEVTQLKSNSKVPEEVEASKAKMKKIQKEVSSKMQDIIAKNKDLFVSKVIKANLEIDLPTEIPTLANGRKDSTYLFNYYKNHFFDHLDFSDERMIYTPFIQGKIDQYFKDLVYQVPDSVIIDCDRVLKKARQPQDVYRYVLWQLTNKYENTTVVGLENVYVHLAENYYLKDAPWLDSSAVARIAKRVKTLSPILPGKIMPNISLPDTTGAIKNLASIKAKYTIVYFYSHECGHCKDHAPELVKFYNENKAKGIEVVAIDSNPNTKLEDLTKFINTYHTEKMINLWDKYHMYNFIDDFDVYSTPTTYILDKDKKIIGKRLQIEEYNKFIDFYEKKMKLIEKMK